MAIITRLAGAYLAQTNHAYYMIGNTKSPCRFEDFGFEPPPRDTEAPDQPILPLLVAKDLSLPASESLEIPLEGDELLNRLVAFFMIARNGSMSERLWQLVIENGQRNQAGHIDGRWLADIPEEAFAAIQDSVLSC